MTSAERTKINDPAVMRALAHPARLELLEHLSTSTEGATATECAAVVGLTPSATSYHLRALAKVGMIHEAPGRGDGRERVWRASHQSYSIASERDAGPEEQAAGQALVELVLARQNEKVRRSIARLRDEPSAWFDIATISELTLAATDDEISRVLSSIDELLEPLKKANRTELPSNVRTVSFQVRAVPID